jgi:hypothetical protein
MRFSEMHAQFKNGEPRTFFPNLFLAGLWQVHTCIRIIAATSRIFRDSSFPCFIRILLVAFGLGLAASEQKIDEEVAWLSTE